MGNNSSVTSVRGNNVPPGGASNPVTTAGAPILASTEQIVQATEQLLASTVPNNIQLQTYNMSQGIQTPIDVKNVGLGYELEELHQLNFTVANTSGVSVTLNVAPEAPFDIVSSIVTQFNGKVNIHNLSGADLLKVMVGRKRQIINPYGVIHPSIASISVSGTGVTTTTGTGLCNLSTIVIPTGDTAIISVVCWMQLPFTYRKEMMLGILPMQNNSIYLKNTVTGATLLGTDLSTMLSTASLTGVTVAVQSWTVKPTYNFLQNIANSQLILPLASTNYLLIRLPNNNVANTGVSAVNWPFPNNFLLTRFHAEFRDSTKKIIPLSSGVPLAANLQNPRLSYNGVLLQDNRETIGRQAKQAFESKGGGLATPGHILFDLQDMQEWPNLEETQFLDMYEANNPSFMLDLLSGLSVPATFTALMEQLVPADVSIVAG
jgi:hypothetical protein